MVAALRAVGVKILLFQWSLTNPPPNKSTAINIDANRLHLFLNESFLIAMVSLSLPFADEALLLGLRRLTVVFGVCSSTMGLITSLFPSVEVVGESAPFSKSLWYMLGNNSRSQQQLWFRFLWIFLSEEHNCKRRASWHVPKHCCFEIRRNIQ